MADNNENKVLNVPHLRFPEFSGEWKKCKLGDLCNVLMCKRILVSQTNTEDGVPFYKIGTIGSTPDAYISKELFDDYKVKYNYPRKGEVMITCAGTVGKCVVYDGEDAYFQDSNIVWIDNPTQYISNGFLFHLLSKVDWRKLNSTTIIRIYNDDLRNLKMSYPRKEEQQKISHLLSLLDERIATQNKIIEDLKLLKSAISLNVLHSDTWEQFKIKDIAQIGRGRVISSIEISQQKNPTYPVYSSQTSNDGIMGYLDDYMFEGEYISWTTDGANAGTVFYRNGKFNCTNVCGLLKLIKGFDTHFVSLVLAEATKKYVSINLANPKLMNNTMGNIQICLPKLEEQKRISIVFRVLQRLWTVHNSLLTEYIKQKQYLLSQMFI
ncbi:restriction endonuclease subunit S [Odoribacter splanchnicus]|uniref:restriction endonuclease subunit S n=2 Tax=Bacteroidales TaxID=171549 RepID=UPI0034A322DB